MSLGYRKVLMKCFIESQFACCSLVGIRCHKTSDNFINYLHERVLRTVFNDNVSVFGKLVDKGLL